MLYLPDLVGCGSVQASASCCFRYSDRRNQARKSSQLVGHSWTTSVDATAQVLSVLRSNLRRREGEVARLRVSVLIENWR